MTATTVPSGNTVTNYLNEINREYVRGGIFGPYKGNDQNAIIQVKQDRQKVSIPLVAKLANSGVTGSSSLSGNEENLSNYSYVLTPTYHRHAVMIDKEEWEKPNFDLYKEAKPALKNWAMELQRDQIIQAMAATHDGTTYTNYGDATAAQLDTWNTNNQDRVLYGSALSNNTSGNHTTSLSAVDTTNDRLDTGILTLLKRMAQNANPLIRPYMVKGDQPYYVFFCDSYGFRDLEENSAIQQAQREAMARGKDNPLFTPGDILWRGVIVKEVPDITKFIDGDGSGSAFDGVLGANAASADGLDNGGNGGSRVGVGFFCGAQAVGFGMGQMAQFTKDKADDYEFQKKVGLEMKHDIDKTFYNSKQHGMITAFYSAPLDS